MKVDRHNYEELFLLYVDGELNVDEKKQVEAFVMANPDLEEELVMLEQSKLIADPAIVFEGKEMLMRREAGINWSNYEGWLVLYTDNELTAEQRSLVEKFAAEHPQVRTELDLFLQTKLEPQGTVFPNKESLYKREERVAVIRMTWWRVAAAAILILAAGVGTYSIINNNKGASVADVARGTLPGVNKLNQKEEKLNLPVIPSQKNSEVPQTDHAVAATDNQKPAGNKKEIITPEKNPANERLIASTTQPVNDSNEETIPSNNSSSSTPVNRSNAVSSLAFNATPDNGSQQIVNISDVTNGSSQTPHFQKLADRTVVGEPVASDEPENKKLRGFFRKATRFIERTTKMNPANDDDKVLIGSMAVSLK